MLIHIRETKLYYSSIITLLPNNNRLENFSCITLSQTFEYNKIKILYNFYKLI